MNTRYTEKKLSKNLTKKKIEYLVNHFKIDSKANSTGKYNDYKLNPGRYKYSSSLLNKL